MWNSYIINIKWVLFYIVSSFVFGAYIPEVVAIEVARNVYLEHEDLHSRDEFIIFLPITIGVFLLSVLSNNCFMIICSQFQLVF